MFQINMSIQAVRLYDRVAVFTSHPFPMLQPDMFNSTFLLLCFSKTFLFSCKNTSGNFPSLIEV